MALNSNAAVMEFGSFVRSAKNYLNTYPPRDMRDIDIVNDLLTRCKSLRDRTILSMSNHADICKIDELCDDLIRAIYQWRNQHGIK